MERYYTDKGVLSKGACLMVQDATDNKYFMLIPTTDMPATKGAPATQEKTVLTDGSVTSVEGLQTNEQKTYTFNYHRDNLRQLNKYKGKQLSFMERNADNTGEKYKGSMTYGRSALAVNGIQQGQMFITVSESDENPVDDVRDLIKKTAIITTPLSDIVLTGTESTIINIETSELATVTATSESTTIATATYTEGKLTITGVAKGNTLIDLICSATGEAASYRTISVTVD